MKNTIKKILGTKNIRIISQVRKTLRIAVYRFFRALYGQKECLPALKTQIFSLPNKHVFFGYYDIPQFSNNQRFLLAGAAPLSNSTPSPDQQLELGFFDLYEKEPEFQKFAATGTWCWQQGCRLQWYPYKGINTVIYNTIVNGKYGCIIQNIDNRNVIKSFTRPVYSVSKDGKWGLSLNFSRLQRLRPGYGYNSLPDGSINNLLPDDDGIWRIDLTTGKEKLLFSLQDISKIEPYEGMEGAQHYFNHILFNPSGNRFMFFHILQVGNKRIIRLLTSSINGDNIYLLNNSGHVSHYCWKNDKQLLAYATITNQGEGYYLFKDCSKSYKSIGKDILTEDGHPSYLPGNEWLITDTYPDKFGEQLLLLFNTENDNLIELSKEYAPAKFHAETRCDLHPRVGATNQYICIDCIRKGKRVMKLLDISSLACA